MSVEGLSMFVNMFRLAYHGLIAFCSKLDKQPKSSRTSLRRDLVFK